MPYSVIHLLSEFYLFAFVNCQQRCGFNHLLFDFFIFRDEWNRLSRIVLFYTNCLNNLVEFCIHLLFCCFYLILCTLFSFCSFFLISFLFVASCFLLLFLLIQFSLFLWVFYFCFFVIWKNPFVRISPCWYFFSISSTFFFCNFFMPSNSWFLILIYSSEFFC